MNDGRRQRIARAEARARAIELHGRPPHAGGNEDDIEKNFSRPPGIAFRLVDMRPDQYEQLKQFLQLRGVPTRQGSRS